MQHSASRYDDKGVNKYENFTCMELCNTSSLKSDCINQFELVRDVTDASLTYVTEIDKEPMNGAPKSSNFVAWDPARMGFQLYYGTHSHKRTWKSDISALPPDDIRAYLLETTKL